MAIRSWSSLRTQRRQQVVNHLIYTTNNYLSKYNTNNNSLFLFSEPPKTENVQENIIDTKPPPPTVANVKPEAINPSKLSDKDKTNKPAAPVVASSSISVIASSPKKDDKLANAPKSNEPKIISKVEVVVGPSKIPESSSSKQSSKKPSKQNSQSGNNKKSDTKNIVSSKVEVKEGPPPSTINSKIEIKSSQAEEEPAILITNNNIGEPEYDFLSRQPSEFVEETYKVINIRPSKVHGQKPKHKNRVHPPPPPPADDDEHPIGLVTTLGGTVVKDGLTTIHETSVIGTYISGKYAQVLNSNSRVLQPSGQRGKISPSPPHRILKTASPSIPKSHRHNLEPTPSIGDDDNFSKNTRRPSSGGSSYKNRHRSQISADNDAHENAPQTKKFKNRNSSSQRTQRYTI